jgi:hypothetical protein
MHRAVARLGCALAAAGLLACTPEALPGVLVDAPRSPTSLETAHLTGRADPGAVEVDITRISPAGAEGSWRVAVAPFSGRWHLDVPLEAGAENVFEVRARAEETEFGSATPATVVHEPVAAQALHVTASPEVVDPRQGTVKVVVVADHPEPVDLHGLEVALHVAEGGETHGHRVLTTDRTGRAETIVSGLHREGLLQVIAESGSVTGEAPVRVEGDPNAPGAIGVILSALVQGVPAGPSDHIAVPAGTEVTVAVDIRDREDAPLDLEVDLRTDLPGAWIEDGVIQGATVAGDHLVVAAEVGGNLYGGATLTVLPGPPAVLDLDVSHEVILAGERLRWWARVADAHGNALPAEPALSVTAEPSGVVVADGAGTGTVRFDEVGTHELVATIGELASRQTVRVADPATAGARVSILSPVHGAILRPDQQLEVSIRAASPHGIAEVRLDVSGAVSAQQRELAVGMPAEVERTFVIETPSELGVLRLTPSAVDGNGAVLSEGTTVVLVHPTVEVAEGHGLRWIAGGPGGGLDGPVGMAWQTPNRLLVGSFYDQRIMRVALPAGTASLFAELDGGPRDVVVDPQSGHVFASHDEGAVTRLTATGGVVSASWASVTTPWGMDLGADGLLYVVTATPRTIEAIPIDDVTSADPDRIVSLDCGGALIGGGRGVRRGEDAGGRRVLYVTSTSNSGLYRCTDDGSGGDVDGEMLTNEGLGYARQLLRLDDGSFLVATPYYGDVKRLVQEADESWTATPIVWGLDFPVGLLRRDGSRILVSDAFEHLVYEIAFPSGG